MLSLAYYLASQGFSSESEFAFRGGASPDALPPHCLTKKLDEPDGFRLKRVKEENRRRVGEEALFVSEMGRPLRKNTIDLLFSRLRKRAEITGKGVNPSLLRDSFAVRYLQAGGDLFTLRELLGQEESAVVRRALHMSER